MAFGPAVSSLRLMCLSLALAAVSAGIASPVAMPGDGRIDKARLLSANRQPGEWLTAGRDYGKTHYSPLTAIDRRNVARLGFAWAFDTRTDRGLEATPIEVDGVLITSGVAGRVYALNAETGAPIWTFAPDVDLQVNRHACCDEVNRGVAVWKGRVYVAALDGMLYALHAATGAVLWKTDTIVDHKLGYSSTGAPQIAGQVVVIGNAGGEADARGYISAYDLESGRLVWRFFTVPGDPARPVENPALDIAAKTWDSHSRWQFGGGGTVWDGMVYDPGLNLLYVGTGNAETYPRTVRSPSGGDNLFSSSILAIDPDDGHLAWYYQETPGDEWDYDADPPLILTDLKLRGTRRKVLMQASKNGVFYVLDRATGKLISAGKFARANWLKSVDMKTGHPIENATVADYTTGPKLVFPSTVGAHNWNPMAYSARTGLVYIPVSEIGNVIFDNGRHGARRQGLWNTGIGLFYTGQILAAPQSLPADVQTLLAKNRKLTAEELVPRGFLRAYDPARHKIVWQVESSGWWDHAGVLATAGGLVMQGTDTGHFRVYDDRSGKLLKDIDLGTDIIAAPMTYSIDGVQYVAVMAGWGGGGWAIPHPASAAYNYGNAGRIVAFRLDGGAAPMPERLPPPEPIAPPPPLQASAAEIARGEALFSADCGICHPNMTRSGSSDLRRMAPEVHANFDEIVLDGAFRSGGMPGWGDVLTKSDAHAIHAYLISQAAKAYGEQQQGQGAGKASLLSHGY